MPSDFADLDRELRARGIVEVRRSPWKAVAVAAPWWGITALSACLLPVAGDRIVVLAIGILFAFTWAMFVTLASVTLGPLRLDDAGIHLGKGAANVIWWSDLRGCERDKWMLSFRVAPDAVARRHDALPALHRVAVSLATFGADFDVIGVPSIFELSAAELAPWLTAIANDRRS